MVRNYRSKMSNCRKGKHFKPYFSYSKSNLVKALDDIKTRKLTIRAAAEKYGIPKSTLGRKLLGQNMQQKRPGRPSLFNDDEENVFVQNLNTVACWGYPFDLRDLRMIAKRYFDKKGVRDGRLNDNMPGKDWAVNFIKRHKNEISNRLSANISTKRAALSEEVLDRFFENASQILSETDPSLIINFDETNLTDDPGSKKFIYKRGTRYPERVINATKTAISLMYAGTADGQLLPIYVVYKADHLWDSWTVGGPRGTRYNRSKSGWFDSICFEDWFFTVVVPFFQNKDGQKLLIGDNLSSHFSEKVLQKCEELNIAFICLPPNATHVMQPLDVAFYAPVKKYWRDILSNWKRTSGRKFPSLTKDAFPSLLTKLQKKLEKGGKGSSNLVSGFSKTGLYPVDPSRPKERLPRAQEPANVANVVSDVIINILKDMRSGDQTNKVARRKRLNVEPGKSVSANDLSMPSTSGSTPHQPIRQSERLGHAEYSCDDEVSRLENIDDTFSDESEELPLIHIKNASIAAEKGHISSELFISGEDHRPENDESENFSDNSDDLPLINIQKFLQHSKNAEISSDEEESISAEVKEGSWIVVEYEIKKSRKHFIGQVKQVLDSTLHVEFLKKSEKSSGKFITPLAQDTDYISGDMVVKILKPPIITGTGRRDFYSFNIDLMPFSF